MKPRRGTCVNEIKTVYALEGIVCYECAIKGYSKCEKAKCDQFECAQRDCFREIKAIKEGVKK